MKERPSQPCKVVMDGPRAIRFTPTELPSHAPAGKILLRTHWTMISTGTELAFYQGYHAGLLVPGNPWAKYPFEPGYAAISEVTDVGAGVTGFDRGQLVFHWGRHATWSVADPSAEVVLPVPAGIDPRHALLARFAQIAGTAVVRLEFVPESVLVIGAGLIGILAARMFELAGSARVTIQDVNEPRLAVAREMGLNAVTAGSTLSPEHPQCVVEATGVQGLIGKALSTVAELGTVVMLGSPGGEQSLNLYRDVFSRSAALVGAHEGRVPVMDGGGGPTRKALNESALSAIGTGKLNVAPLITATVPYFDIESAYRALIEDKDHHLATVVSWKES